MNILGHFTLASEKLKFLIVIVDYFTKLIEVEPMGKSLGIIYYIYLRGTYLIGLIFSRL